MSGAASGETGVGGWVGGTVVVTDAPSWPGEAITVGSPGVPSGQPGLPGVVPYILRRFYTLIKVTRVSDSPLGRCQTRKCGTDPSEGLRGRGCMPEVHAPLESRVQRKTATKSSYGTRVLERCVYPVMTAKPPRTPRSTLVRRIFAQKWHRRPGVNRDRTDDHRVPPYSPCRWVRLGVSPAPGMSKSGAPRLRCYDDNSAEGMNYHDRIRT